MTIPMLQHMARARKLTEEDRAQKRKIDEIHPFQGITPYDIARQLISHFEEPPAFHKECLDSDQATLRDGTHPIEQLIEYFECQADAINEVRKGFSRTAEEECRLDAQHKFIDNATNVLRALLPSTEAWVSLEYATQAVTRRRKDLEAAKSKVPELFDSGECDIETFQQLLIMGETRVAAAQVDFNNRHSDFLVATLPAIVASKMAKARIGRKYDDVRKKLAPAPVVISGSVLAKALANESLVADGLMAKEVDGVMRPHCKPCNHTFHQCIYASLLDHFEGRKAKGSKLRQGSKRHSKNATAWKGREKHSSKVKAATAAALEKLYGDLSGATTDAKREELLAVLIQDEDFQQMLLNDPVDIHPVFISIDRISTLDIWHIQIDLS